MINPRYHKAPTRAFFSAFQYLRLPSRQDHHRDFGPPVRRLAVRLAFEYWVHPANSVAAAVVPYGST